MNGDLKIIKKKYGENMSKLCRELFPTLLETEGLLSKLMMTNFNPSHILYDDIMHYNLEEKFKNYIYNQIDVEKKEKINLEKTPQELLDEAGYILYECHSEKDIQKFKKYYAKGEELCTFRGERLDRCHIFFAVNKDVNNIRREDFDNPKRQDLYGTSVISIQFTRDNNHTLSIKNRYNHTVNNPDSTFSNNLDNIIPGLTESFEREYGLIQKNGTNIFEIPDYVKANNKYYKYNYEINNIYYCPDNIIIDNFEVKKLDKEKYILLDYFILNLQDKSISLYDDKLEDGFIDSIGVITKIEIKKEKDEKNIFIQEIDGNIITITLDKENKLIGYKNDSVQVIKDNFLGSNKYIKTIEIPRVQKIGDYFLTMNNVLKELELPKSQEIGDYFLYNNQKFKKMELPKIKTIGNKFLYYNIGIKSIKFPNIQKIGDNFLKYNKLLIEIELPEIQKIGNKFLENNKHLKSIKMAKVQEIGNHFLYSNVSLKSIELPRVQKIGDLFLSQNKILEDIKLPEVKIIGSGFMDFNRSLKEIKLPEVKKIGGLFLLENENLKTAILPKCTKIDDHFLCYNESLEKLELPNIQEIGDNFLIYNLKFSCLSVEDLRQQSNLLCSEESRKKGK